MKTLPEEDPLQQLNKKALRRLARKYKIKHFYRKSPATLRRAIRRAQEREPISEQIQPAILQTQAQTSREQQSETSPPKGLSAEALVDQRRQSEQEAYQEHRLRYLHAPSRFVHKGTHEEYILEKDEEIELPDFYAEDELVALSIDPQRFYVYWDFEEETLFDVRSWLAEDTPFMLRVHDVTNLLFNGRNSHQSWEVKCHPLVREWYVQAPVNNRNVLVELGVVLNDGFHSILQSNPILIPPVSVSPVRQDEFAVFVAQPLRPEEKLQPVSTALLPEQQAHKPETSAKFFFQEYVPSPVQFNPLPPAKSILERQPADQPAILPWTLPEQHQVPERAVFLRLPDAETLWEAEEARLPQTQPEQKAIPQPEMHWQAEQTETDPESEDTLAWIRQAGKEQIQTWLGLPQEIRWLSDIPSDLSPIFFEQWVTDPYDRAMMLSYSIWPWEIVEHIPLGASDELIRRFLGASLFSWFKPGSSERMVWWQRPLGASERSQWQQPLGASESLWSGSLQPSRSPGESAWHLWPTPVSGRGLLS